MTRHKYNSKPFIKLRSFYLWHRYVGISAAVFLLTLAISGLFLNHTVTLKMDRSFISSEWLLDWYEVEAPQRTINYATKDHSVTLIEDKLYLDKKSINGHFESLAGAIELQGMVIIAIDTQLLLFTADGELIERISDINGRRVLLGAIGTLDKRIVIQTDDFLITDIDFSTWQTASKKDILHIAWSYPTRLSNNLRLYLAHDYRSNILTLERIMLDLHSGRIFGDKGVYLMDAAAIMLILLALSGSFIWIQQLRKRHQHKKTAV